MNLKSLMTLASVALVTCGPQVATAQTKEHRLKCASADRKFAVSAYPKLHILATLADELFSVPNGTGTVTTWTVTLNPRKWAMIPLVTIRVADSRNGDTVFSLQSKGPVEIEYSGGRYGIKYRFLADMTSKNVSSEVDCIYSKY